MVSDLKTGVPKDLSETLCQTDLPSTSGRSTISCLVWTGKEFSRSRLSANREDKPRVQREIPLL